MEGGGVQGGFMVLTIRDGGDSGGLSAGGDDGGGLSGVASEGIVPLYF
jgi:hypothetical protein